MLVVAQVTISLVVLICAGLFIRSLGKARQTDPGFQTENLVTMMLDPGLLAYDQQPPSGFFPNCCAGSRRCPACARLRSPARCRSWTADSSRGPVVKEGEIDPPPNQGVISDCGLVTPKYFDTVRMPLVRGRDFTERDDTDAPPVVIVNQEFARRFYGSEREGAGQTLSLRAGHAVDGDRRHRQGRAL